MNDHVWLRDRSGDLIRASSIDKLMLAGDQVTVRTGTDDWHSVARLSQSPDRATKDRHLADLALALSQYSVNQRPIVIGWDGADGSDEWVASRLDE